MKEKEPKIVKISGQDLDKLKTDLEKSNLSGPQKKILMTVLEAYYWLSQMYQLKKLSMNKIARLLGFKTEKKKKKKKDQEESDDKKNNTDDNTSSKDKGKGKPKGHGRNGKKNHPDAKRVTHKLKDLKKGDQCPLCPLGKLYPVAPGIAVHFTGHAPIQTTVHETEKLRCNACGAYFEAELPEEFKEKYHPSCDVAVAVQKYALGLPFYRIASGSLQSSKK